MPHFHRWTGVELLKVFLIRRMQPLDRRLSVELTRQHIHQLRMGKGNICEPVLQDTVEDLFLTVWSYLLCQGEDILELQGKISWGALLKKRVVDGRGAKSFQAIKNDPRVQTLGVAGKSSLAARVLGPVLGEDIVVVGGQVPAYPKQGPLPPHLPKLLVHL